MPHVQAILKRRKINDLVKKTGTLLLGWVTMGVSDVAKTVLEIVKESSETIEQIESAFNIRKTGLKSHSVIEGERIRPVEICHDFLAAILSGKESKKFPVVIILDDAQWIDRYSLLLFKRFYTKAVLNKWPVLIIATHWEHKWFDYLEQIKIFDSEQEKKEISNFAELINSLQKEKALTNWQPYKLGKLADQSIYELIQQSFVGITSEQIDKILKKVDGNPIYLGDVIAYLKNSSRNFTNKDFSQTLSIKGLEQLYKVISTDHTSLIRARYESLTEDLRVLLAHASYQGIHFNDELTVETAIKLGEFQDKEKTHLLLKTAIYPKNIANPIDDQFMEFRQRSFFEIARETFNEEDKECFKKAQMSVIIDWYKQGRFENFETNRKIKIYKWLDKNKALLPDDTPTLGMLYLTLGDISNSESSFIERERYLNQAIKEFRQDSEGDKKYEMVAFFLMGDLYRQQFSFHDAETSYKAGLELIKQKGIKVKASLLGKIFKKLAVNYYIQKQYQKAVSYYQQALTNYSKDNEATPRNEAYCQYQLGWCLTKQAQYPEAIAYYQQALTNYSKDNEATPRDEAKCQFQLGFCFLKQEQFQDALPYIQLSLMFYSDENEVAPLIEVLCFELLGHCFLGINQILKAEDCYHNALAIYENQLQEHSDNRAKILNNLGCIKIDQEHYQEAKQYFKKALALFESQFGLDSSEVALVHSNLGESYEKQKQYREAEMHYQRALAIRIEMFGNEHIDVATSLNDLARLYSEQLLYQEADSYRQRALEISEKISQ